MHSIALILLLSSLFSSVYTQPTPANVVCYQTIVGSLEGTYEQVSADLSAWSQQMYNTLGLTGDIGLHVNHARVPDRDSFENGCNGPYPTVADLFVHIQATSETYDAISDSLEAYIASHPVTSLSSISCAARSIVDELPTCGKIPTPTGANPTQPPNGGGEVPTPADVVCYQEIVGSLQGTSQQVSAALDAWSLKMYNALGLAGDIGLHVNHAPVPDRDSFENGCNGPYTAVADLFVHIQTTNAEYDAVSAALEAFIAANPLTNAEFAPIDCSARSVVTYLPTCGKTPTPTSTPTGANPTQPPNGGGEVPTPADVVCYQEIVGSLQGTSEQVSAALDAWSLKMYNSLGLTGDIGLHVNHAPVPDRDSFENGCNGPYTAVADLFVHIQTTNANYDAVSAALEAFIAANPLTNAEFAPIDCSARSVTTYLPTCGKTSTPTSTPTGANPTQPNGDNPTQPPEVPTPADVVCYQEIVGSLQGTSEQVSAALDAWSQKMYNALGLTGDIGLHVNHAPVSDRDSFENGCNGPYTAVADLFVHIQTTNANYDAVSAALEAFIAANPLTNAEFAPIDCSARSVTTYLPRCGKTPTPTSTPTGANPTQPPNGGGEVPTPADVVCYQEIVGSLQGTSQQVSAALDAWSLKMYNALGLTGPIDTHVNHAPVPDRDSFENGCNGPYTAVADLFVHIQTTNANYDAVSAALEAFIAANPLTNAEFAPIDCSARSVTTYLPTCGKTSTPTGANPPQPGNGGSPRSCPVTTYSSSIIDSGAAAAAGKRLYTITYDLTNGDANIQFIDIHITTASGFYNARMQLSPSASPTSPSYEFIFPEYLALGPGEAVSWWFTTAINIEEEPGIWACDSASTSYTTPGTPTGPNPTSPPAPTGSCPAIAFNHAIVHTGLGETTGTGAYAITFANASPDRTVEWVDVHITANGGQFNYRMDLSPDATPTSISFITHLPSPHLNLAPGTIVEYWFTYESQGTACDTSTFTFTTTLLE